MCHYDLLKQLTVSCTHVLYRSVCCVVSNNEYCISYYMFYLGKCVGLQAYARLDTFTKEVQAWFPGARCFCEEPIFVPGPPDSGREDSGWLLGMVFDAEKMRSSLVVCLN
jgi:Retinal pigment epithelial membrane protein